MKDKGKGSPFCFGNIVTRTDTNFIDREQERERLRMNARSGINTILISPRRWGKSSLVRTVAEDMADRKDIRFCFIDLFKVHSEEEFLMMLAQEVMKATASSMEDLFGLVKEFLHGITPQLSFSADPLHQIKFGFDVRQIRQNPRQILDLAQKVAEKKKLQTVVCIDEFQNLNYFDRQDHFQKQLRSHWQHHNKVTYFLYGSKRHMMADIFNTYQRPFYRFGDLINLPKLPKEDLVNFIVSAFRRTGRSIGKKLARKIVEHMDCHPYYVQQLAHLTWVRTSTKADEEMITSGLSDMMNQNSMFYEREVEMMSRTQINFLKALADGHQKFSSKDVLHDYDIGTSANVVKIKKALEDKEIIDTFGESVTFLDPAFEMWFIKRVMS